MPPHMTQPCPHTCTRRAVTDSIRKGLGPTLTRIVNEAGGAAGDAFLTVGL